MSNDPAPDHVVSLFKWIAGDGDLDQRCRRILQHSSHRWWGRQFVPLDELMDVLGGVP